MIYVATQTSDEQIAEALVGLTSMGSAIYLYDLTGIVISQAYYSGLLPGIYFHITWLGHAFFFVQKIS